MSDIDQTAEGCGNGSGNDKKKVVVVDNRKRLPGTWESVGGWFSRNTKTIGVVVGTVAFLGAGAYFYVKYYADSSEATSSPSQ